MDRPRRLSASEALNRVPSSQSVNKNVAPSCRIRPSSSSFSVTFPQSVAAQSLIRHPSQMRSSRTWTPSSGGLGLLSDADEVQDRGIFVEEYNRLAKKHGIRLLVVGDFEAPKQSDETRSPEKRGWFFRIFRGSPSRSTPNKPPQILRPRHKRSVSDLGYLIHSRREPPKVLGIQTMVRLCGKSVLYLPQEYSPCSLILPTCIRATAHHIAQNATTRGIFRIPGSIKIVNTIFDYYCHMEHDSLNVAGTVCCATLPTHIDFSTHDVSSTFKRFLSILPGGILGSLSLFDAFVGIHSQLHGEPEFPRTKHTKVRARLIALAIGTIESQYRRELICAVFGILSLIGRAAEVSPREDEDGRPLPTADLMGYGALGIIFGPLLIGDLLDQYSMKLATPLSGLLLLPVSPRKQRRERHKSKADMDSKLEPPHVDKVKVANDIAEMLITNWRDVVRQMKALGTHHRHETASGGQRSCRVRSSSPESFIIKIPQDLSEAKRVTPSKIDEHEKSPEADTPTMALRRHRSRPMKASTNHSSDWPTGCPSDSANEKSRLETRLHRNNASRSTSRNATVNSETNRKKCATSAPNSGCLATPSCQTCEGEDQQPSLEADISSIDCKHLRTSPMRKEETISAPLTPSILVDTVPPRTSSKHTNGNSVSTMVSIIDSHQASNSLTVMSERRGSSSEHSKQLEINIMPTLCDLHAGRAVSASPLLTEHLQTPKQEAKSALQPLDDLAGLDSALDHSSISDFPEKCVHDHHSIRDVEESEFIVPTSAHTSTRSREADGCSDPKDEAPMLQHHNTSDQIYGLYDEKFQREGLLMPEMNDLKIIQQNFRRKEPLYVSAASDVSDQSPEQSIRDCHYSMNAADDGPPAKRTSVRTLAARFETQQDDHRLQPGRARTRSEESTHSSQGQDLDGSIESHGATIHAICNHPRGSTEEVHTVITQGVIETGPILETHKSQPLNPSGGYLNFEEPVHLRKPDNRDITNQPISSPSPRSNRHRKKILQSASSSEQLLPQPTSLSAREQQDPAESHDLLSNGYATAKDYTPRKIVPERRTSDLQARVQNLERLLNLKKEEIIDLRAQLQNQEMTHIVALKNQLTEVMRGLDIWKDRAQAAERRLQMFEKFTTSPSGSQPPMERESPRRSSSNLHHKWRIGSEARNGEDGVDVYRTHRVRFARPHGSQGTDKVEHDSGELDDGHVVPARIRNCLHHNSGKFEHSDDDSSAAPGDLHSMDGVTSPANEAISDIGPEKLAMWITTEELLRGTDTDLIESYSIDRDDDDDESVFPITGEK